jgi:hypothetical protein
MKTRISLEAVLGQVKQAAPVPQSFSKTAGLKELSHALRDYAPTAVTYEDLYSVKAGEVAPLPPPAPRMPPVGETTKQAQLRDLAHALREQAVHEHNARYKQAEDTADALFGVTLLARMAAQ